MFHQHPCNEKSGKVTEEHAIGKFTQDTVQITPENIPDLQIECRDDDQHMHGHRKSGRADINKTPLPSPAQQPLTWNHFCKFSRRGIRT